MKKILIALVIIIVLIIPVPQKHGPMGCEFGPCYYSYNSIGTMVLRNFAGIFGVHVAPPDRMGPPGEENIIQPEPNQPTPTPVQPTKQCIKSGCSGQICSDHQEISTCEFRAEYACYQSATCEVQPTGECGWTPSDQLSQCLLNAK